MELAPPEVVAPSAAASAAISTLEMKSIAFFVDTRSAIMTGTPFETMWLTLKNKARKKGKEKAK